MVTFAWTRWSAHRGQPPLARRRPSQRDQALSTFNHDRNRLSDTPSSLPHRLLKNERINRHSNGVGVEDEEEVVLVVVIVVDIERGEGSVRTEGEGK